MDRQVVSSLWKYESKYDLYIEKFLELLLKYGFVWCEQDERDFRINLSADEKKLFADDFREFQKGLTSFDIAIQVKNIRKLYKKKLLELEKTGKSEEDSILPWFSKAHSLFSDKTDKENEILKHENISVSLEEPPLTTSNVTLPNVQVKSRKSASLPLNQVPPSSKTAIVTLPPTRTAISTTTTFSFLHSVQASLMADPKIRSVGQPSTSRKDFKDAKPVLKTIKCLASKSNVETISKASVTSSPFEMTTTRIRHPFRPLNSMSPTSRIPMRWSTASSTLGALERPAISSNVGGIVHPTRSDNVVSLVRPTTSSTFRAPVRPTTSAIVAAPVRPTTSSIVGASKRPTTVFSVSQSLSPPVVKSSQEKTTPSSAIISSRVRIPLSKTAHSGVEVPLPQIATPNKIRVLRPATTLFSKSKGPIFMRAQSAPVELPLRPYKPATSYSRRVPVSLAASSSKIRVHPSQIALKSSADASKPAYLPSSPGVSKLAHPSPSSGVSMPAHPLCSSGVSKPARPSSSSGVSTPTHLSSSSGISTPAYSSSSSGVSTTAYPSSSPGSYGSAAPSYSPNFYTSAAAASRATDFTSAASSPSAVDFMAAVSLSSTDVLTVATPSSGKVVLTPDTPYSKGGVSLIPYRSPPPYSLAVPISTIATSSGSEVSSSIISTPKAVVTSPSSFSSAGLPLSSTSQVNVSRIISQTDFSSETRLPLSKTASCPNTGAPLGPNLATSPTTSIPAPHISPRKYSLS